MLRRCFLTSNNVIKKYDDERQKWGQIKVCQKILVPTPARRLRGGQKKYFINLLAFPSEKIAQPCQTNDELLYCTSLQKTKLGEEKFFLL